MKYFIITTLSLFIACTSTITDQGFTNKSEAKNEMVSDKKEGKWLEYVDSTYHITSATDAPYYHLTIYMAGKPYGVSYEYYKSGKLEGKVPYMYGKINGIVKYYYENGNLKSEIHYFNNKAIGIVKKYWENGSLESIDDLVNGVYKEYYLSGRLFRESPNINGLLYGVQKEYYENGKLKDETPYYHGKGETTYYDTNGHEIK